MEQPSQAQIEELRSAFLKKLEEEPPAEAFHPADIARVKAKDDWLARFLVHHDLSMREALTMLWDTCEWRKTTGTNDISEDNVKMEYLEDGSMFSYSKDKDGKAMFVLKCKKHVKGQRDFEELKRCFVYWFERLERQTKGDMITIFFDMAETGLSNLDMDFMKYLISLFKLYYPNFLNYIIIFEMPWVLNAAFKIIKSWLPPKAVAKIKMVNKSSLKDLVDPENAMKSWGGQDDFTFSFTPEVRPASSEVKEPKEKHKVHFADGSPTSDTPTTEGSRVKIEPRMVCFVYKDGTATATINLTNSDSSNTVTYKIKTTSPDSYTVKPTSGLLKPLQTITVSIILGVDFAHHKDAIAKDRFLVMARVPDKPLKNAQEITEFWKSGKAKEQHRLHCVLSGAEGGGGGGVGGGYHNGAAGSTLVATKDPLFNVTAAVTTILERSERLEAESRRIRQILYFLIALVIVLAAMLALIGQQVRQDALQAALQAQDCSLPL